MSAVHNEFYRKAYIIHDTDIKEIKCELKNCIDVLGIENQIYFVVTNSLNTYNCELSIYSYSENNHLTLFYQTNHAINLTNFSINFDYMCIAYASGKVIKIFDFNGRSKGKIRIHETILDFSWIDHGNYIIVSANKGFYLFEGKEFTLLDKYNSSKDFMFLGIKCRYNSKYFCSIWQGETLLFEIN